MNIIFKKYSYVIAGILLVLAPIIAYAHVKWFAHTQATARPYMLTDIPVLLTIAIGLMLIITATIADNMIPVPAGITRLVRRYAPSMLSLASIGFGCAFIIFSVLGFIFAPPMVAQGWLGIVLLIIQALAGVMILLGWYERIGGLLIVCLWILAVAQFGFVEMLDTLEILGFALYAIIIGRPRWKIAETALFQKPLHRIHEYAVPIMRFATGLNLVILGCTEKIFVPGLTATFLSQYHWNFLHTLGWSGMSDYWFAFIAGSVEVLFGILLMFGLVTRITIIGLALFLLTTLIILGPMELIGHLPHFSIALVLLVFGSGSRITWRRWLDTVRGWLHRLKAGV